VPEEEISFNVAIDPSLPREINEPAVAFGDFVSSHPGAVIYPPDGVSQLSQFYVDLICGKSIPVQFLTRELNGLGTILALTLFLDRTLVLNPKVGGLISAMEMVTALRVAGMAHVDRDLSRFFAFADAFMFGQGEKISKKEMEHRLTSVVHWFREYLLEDKLPNMPPEPPPPKVLDTGTNGFVLAETEKPQALISGVIELYRLGHLRGVLFAGNHVLAFRKSLQLRFDLEKAAGDLNQAEAALGRPEGWNVAQGLYLSCPEDGTPIPRETLVKVFVRI